MERAYVGTGKHPHDVDYVECHATGEFALEDDGVQADFGVGTAAGDPTESNWVGARFGGRGEELIIGSEGKRSTFLLTATSLYVKRERDGMWLSVPLQCSSSNAP